MSITIGTIREMIKDLPDDREVIISTGGVQKKAYMCGLARKAVGSQSYAMDGEFDEEGLDNDTYTLMLRTEI